MTRTALAWLAAIACSTAACGPSLSGSQPAVADAKATPLVAPVPVPSGDIQFRAVRDLGQAPKGGEAYLRGGEEADSTEWPASLFVTFRVPQGMATCTAALIGPRAMLTAAHCVPANGVVTFVYEGHRQPYTTSCARHPRYTGLSRDASADFALCTVSPQFAAPAGFLYETVNTAATTSSVSRRTLILGSYGCISDAVPTSHVDGKYRIGFSDVVDSSDSPDRRRGPDLYAPLETNNLFTRDDPRRPNRCPGDTGGPAFLPGATGMRPLAARTIVGVTSRVLYADSSRTSYGASLISATGGPDFRKWAEQWARQSSVSACGVAGSLSNCRN